MISDQIIGQNSEAIDSVINNRPQSFNYILKNYFCYDSSRNYNVEERIKEAAKFNRFHLPAEQNEFIYCRDEAPLIWFSESPLNNFLKEYYKLHFPRVNGVDHFKSLRDYYVRWLLINDKSEKKYFATSLLNIIDKASIKNNFLGTILNAVVLSNDAHCFNPEKAIDLFEIALDEVKTLNEFSSELQYHLKIFIGITYFSLSKFEEAKNNLNEALQIRPNGITAKLNLASAETLLGNQDSGEYLLKELITLDSARIKYAIENQNRLLLIYLFEHPVYSLLNHYPEFNFYSEAINLHLDMLRSSNEEMINKLLSRFKEMDYSKFEAYSDEISSNLLFIRFCS